MDIYFHGFWRMDWGLGNPNATGALIAILMVAVWSLAYIRKWGFWLALTLFTALGVCLIHTFSRGGLIAAGVGLAILIFKLPRPWPWSRIISMAVSVWIIIGATLYVEANQRFAQGIVKEDRSITNRLLIWRSTPQMMVDAPHGWGFKQASAAFMQWYQPVDRSEAYLNLINTHLTWLVELGWAGRFLYLFGWLAAILLCWLPGGRSWSGVLSGVWIAFFVAGIFSHVAESPWLWLTPGICLAAAIAARISSKMWPSPKIWAGAAAGATLVLLTFYGIGTRKSNLAIRGNERRVILGQGEPTVWIVASPKTMGANYGKTLRRYLAENQNGPVSIGVVQSVAEIPKLPEAAKISIVTGGALAPQDLVNLTGLLPKSSRLTLLAPEFQPQELGLQPNRNPGIEAIFGDFSQSPAQSNWNGSANVHRIEGTGDFFPQWPELVFSPSA